MIGRLRDQPLGVLTRHFLRGLFDVGLFSQEGADAFVRVVIGTISLIVTCGLLLVYMYAKKYAALYAALDAQAYVDALAADMTLAIALPMWMVAAVTVLFSHSLFPDETDYRVLMPLPIGRGVVFAAKLLALAAFAGIFTATTHVAVTPLVMLISAGRWAAEPMPLAVAVFFTISVPASWLRVPHPARRVARPGAHDRGRDRRDRRGAAIPAPPPLGARAARLRR